MSKCTMPSLSYFALVIERSRRVSTKDTVSSILALNLCRARATDQLEDLVHKGGEELGSCSV